MLAGLRWLALRMGRTPRNVDINEKLPFSHATYYEVFGSMTAAQEAAGLEPNRQGGQREAPAPSEEFREEWAWLWGYADPKEAIQAARERREELEDRDRHPSHTAAAWELAKEWGLCIAFVEGTGPEGRVLEGDVERALDDLRERLPDADSSQP